MSQPAVARPAGNNRWLAFTILCSAHLMIVLDISIVSVALPSIQRDLGFTQAGLAWTTNAYTIAYGGLLLLSGRFGDLLGRKLIFVGGLAVFTAASLACGLSTSAEMLVISRFIQGIGAAMAIAVVMAMIFGLFSEQADIAKAIGILSFASAAGASIGIVVGGILTEAIDWRWVFFINVPIGLAALLLAIPVVTRDRGYGLSNGADVLGGILATSGLMLLVYAIVQVGTYGWGSMHTIGFGAAAIVLLVAFVVRQATARSPLMPLRIFSNRNLSGANVVQFLSQAGALGFNFLGALYLQQVVGYSPTTAAFAFLPIAVLMGIVSIGLSATLMAKFGPLRVLAAGLVLLGSAMLLIARAPADASYWVDILPTALLLGAGFGCVIPPLVTFSMSVSQPQDQGLASGLFNTSGMAGGAIGLAVLATVAGTRTQNLVAAGENAREAQNSGLHLAFIISAVLIFASLVVALLSLRPQPWAQQAPSEEPAQQSPEAPESVPAS